MQQSLRFAMHGRGVRELSLSVGDEGYRLPGSTSSGSRALHPSAGAGGLAPTDLQGYTCFSCVSDAAFGEAVATDVLEGDVQTLRAALALTTDEVRVTLNLP